MNMSNIPTTHYDSSASQTIQFLIDTNGYKSYLELGCRANTTFKQINCSKKISVDKNPGGTFTMTTDEYFRSKNNEKFDIIFVDAGHVHDQVMRDVTNSLLILNEGGTIVMHDCYPYVKEYERLDGGASGTVWRAFVHLRTDPNLDIICGNYDHGIGIIRRGTNTNMLNDIANMDDLCYEDLITNIEKWLNLRSWQEVKNWILNK